MLTFVTNIFLEDLKFYFRNIPHDISYIALRQGFELSRFMEDVYLAQKRNVNGGVFGFVRYGNVKDVDKLLKAVNNVWFGDWRVVAKVSSFDIFGNKMGGGRERGEREKSLNGDKKLEGEKRKVGGVTGYMGETSKAGEGNVHEGVKKKGLGYAQVVRGEEGGGEKIVRRDRGNEELDVVAAGKKIIPKYASTEQDVNWDRNGMVVSVLNGEAIPVDF